MPPPPPPAKPEADLAFISRSDEIAAAANRPRIGRARKLWRRNELLGIVGAGIVVAFGLHLAYKAKSAGFPEIDRGLASKQLLNLNTLNAREDLLPALSSIPSQHAREETARQIYYASGGLSNVGALARIHGLFTGEQFRQLKPLFVVRRPAQFRGAFLLWSALFFAVFLAVHLFWSLRGFRGDQVLLPVVMLLCGAGMILMIALRDPVRDNMLLVDFAQGVVGGCVLLGALSLLDYERLLGKLTFVPLLASFALSLALILFGHGPGTSDAKVNLLGFQPVEIIRLLLVLFLAGYFGSRWDVLRHARETRPRLAALSSRVDIPPAEYTLPALVCALLSVVFFFAQHDMGPALVFACLFLVLYGMARGSALVPVAGLLLVIAGFVVGDLIGIPRNVGERVSMWLSPWDNLIHGGDQLAHSLWAYATGGAAGMGTGLGDPQLVPAGHTDLILSALGEEWGFVGVALVFGLYARDEFAQSFSIIDPFLPIPYRETTPCTPHSRAKWESYVEIHQPCFRKAPAANRANAAFSTGNAHPPRAKPAPLRQIPSPDSAPMPSLSTSPSTAIVTNRGRIATAACAKSWSNSRGRNRGTGIGGWER